MSKGRVAASRLSVMLVFPVLLLLVLIATQSGVPTHYRNIRINNVGSLNWAGYASATNFTSPQPSVNIVNASWVVQAASKTSSSTYSSQWLGIGGYFANDNSLIQTGTESDYYSGSSHYSAWWELIPAGATTISGFQVSPGDIMSASITLLNKTGNSWLITIKDVTKNEVFTKTVTYGSSMLSAEYVEERPELCNIFGSCSLATLANFGTAYYGYDYSGISGTELAAYGANGIALGSAPNQAITMYSSSGPAIATPSALTSDGTSFLVAYNSGTGTTTTTTTVATTSTIPAGDVLLNISVTATDSHDPYLRDWDLYVGTYPYLNTSTYTQNLNSGGTLNYKGIYPASNNTIYFYIGQSGGSAYGTYSGTMKINGYSASFAGVDNTHALRLLFNSTLGVTQNSVIVFVPSTTTTVSTTTVSTSTTRSTTMSTTRSTTLSTTRTTTRSTTTTIRRRGG